MVKTAEARQIVLEHGDNARQILLDEITRAIRDENDAEAIRLDQLLVEVERLLSTSSVRQNRSTAD